MNALEFADMIERYNAGVMSQKICEDYKDAADELRRLHAQAAQDEALLRQATREMEHGLSRIKGA